MTARWVGHIHGDVNDRTHNGYVFVGLHPLEICGVWTHSPGYVHSRLLTHGNMCMMGFRDDACMLIPPVDVCMLKFIHDARKVGPVNWRCVHYGPCSCRCMHGGAVQQFFTSG